MTIITIGQRKGGNGKSTCTLNLAHVLAERGKRVLIIDLDDQKNTTSAIAAVAGGTRTIEDLLVDDEATLDDAALETLWRNVWLCPASGNLSGAIRHLDGDVGGHLALREKLGSCDRFDIVLIDTSPSMNILVINAMCASDFLLVPVSSKYFSLQGLSQTIQAFTRVRDRLHPELVLLGIAFVIHDKRSVLAVEVLDQARVKHPGVVFESVVGVNIKIEEAQVQKRSIIDYASGDRGADQYRALGAEVLERIAARACATGAAHG
jgi:chromosome partitioning protein